MLIPKVTNPYVIIAALLAIGGAGVYGLTLGVKIANADRLKDEAVIVKMEQAAQRGAAKGVVTARDRDSRTTQELNHALEQNPLSGDCRVSDDGVRALNAILEGRDFPTGGSGLPEGDPPY